MMELHSFEAEQCVLAIATDPKRVDEVMSQARESLFSHSQHIEIYRAMRRLYEKSAPIDIVSVILELGDKEKAGYVSDLYKISFVADLDYYLGVLREFDLKRRLHEVGAELLELVKVEPAAVVLESACSKLLGIGGSNSQKGPRLFREIFVEHGPEIERRVDNQDKLNGVATGFKDIDHRLNGMKPGDLIIVAARPSMGKTTFSLDICKNVALAGGTVLVFSMEMSDRSLIEKVIASTGKLEAKKLKNGRIFDDQEDCSKFSASVVRLKDSKLLIDDRPGLSPTDLRASAIKVQRQYGKIDLIMVDYLQLMKIPGCKDGRTNEVSEISRALKALAKEMECPVIALSQLNRSVENRPNKRPVNSDLRDSGAIEQDADLICFLYRDDYYNADSQNKGITEVIWGKNREGEVGTDYLVFLGQFSRFEDKAPGWTYREQAAPTKQARGFSYDD